VSRLQVAAEKGVRAQTLMDDPLFQEALAAVRDRHRRTWERSAPEDREIREQAYQALAAVSELERELRIVLGSGRLAANQLEREG
jgi:hypothetical protein